MRLNALDLVRSPLPVVSCDVEQNSLCMVQRAFVICHGFTTPGRLNDAVPATLQVLQPGQRFYLFAFFGRGIALGDGLALLLDAHVIDLSRQVDDGMTRLLYSLKERLLRPSVLFRRRAFSDVG